MAEESRGVEEDEEENSRVLSQTGTVGEGAEEDHDSVLEEDEEGEGEQQWKDEESGSVVVEEEDDNGSVVCDDDQVEDVDLVLDPINVDGHRPKELRTLSAIPDADEEEEDEIDIDIKESDLEEEESPERVDSLDYIERSHQPEEQVSNHVDIAPPEAQTALAIAMTDDEHETPKRHGYMSLGLLVNDRTAEATMKLHIIDGHSIIRLWVVSFLLCTVGAVLSMIAVYLSRNAGDSQVQSLQPLLFSLVIRSVLSVIMTLASVVFTIIIGFRMQFKRDSQVDLVDPGTAAENPSRIRNEAQVIVLVMTWCAWFISPLNPAVNAVDLYAYYLAQEQQSVEVFFNYWPRERYNSVADSLFVSSQFYGVIYLMKWTRLEALKRERVLRNVFGAETAKDLDTASEKKSFDSVRSLRGLIPRVIALYMVARIAFGQGFDFGMGWIPSIAWISVARYCPSTSSFENLATCDTYPVNARASCVVLFCMWDVLLLIWLLFEWWLARNVLSLYYLLQGRTNLVTFYTIVTCGVLHWFFIFTFGIASVAASSAELLDYGELSNTGVAMTGSILGLAVLSWMGILMFLFLPSDIDLLRIKLCRCSCKCCGKPNALDESPKSKEERITSSSVSSPPLQERSLWQRFVEMLEKIALLRSTSTYHYVKSFQEFRGSTISWNEDIEEQEETQADVICRCLQRDCNNILAFDVVALLWNFAHTVYLTGNSKYPQSDSDVQLLVEDEQFMIVEQILDDAYETYCAIFHSSDMIVIAFRGNGSRIGPVLATVQSGNCTFISPVTGSRVNNPRSPRDLQETGLASEDLEGGSARSKLQEQAVETEAHEQDEEAVGKVWDPLLFACCGRDRPLVWKDLYERYLGLFPRILEVVDQLQRDRSRPVFCTGHGVGGAYASFCAGDLAHQRIGTVLSTYTFGTPRFCNAAYRRWYEEKVFNHFDIANVSDKLHGLTTREAFTRPKKLVRLGLTVLLDSLGNLVIDPDWLEIQLMRRSKRKRFNGHEPLTYTSGLMMWSHRMYGANYRPLWTSSLHEIKLALLLASDQDMARLSWQDTILRAYLSSSEVGLGPYLGSACVKVQVKQITGLLAKSSMCIVSCGPQGISSSLWEVGKTNIASLHERSTLAGLNLDSNDDSEKESDEDCEDQVGDEDYDEEEEQEEGEGDKEQRDVHESKDAKQKQARDSENANDSFKQEKSSHKSNATKKKKRKKEKKEHETPESNRERKQGEQGLNRRQSKSSLLGLGVDAEALAAITPRCADFTESEAILFGTYQKLRPCAVVTIAGVDTKYGNFGTVSFPITKLFPIPEDGVKRVSFELTGRARKEDAGELKVHLEVQSIGKIPLESMCDSQSIAWEEQASGASGSLLRSLYPSPFDRDQQQPVARRLQQNIRISRPMATFYLKRNFNRNSQKVVLRVGVIKAAFRTIDLKMGKESPATQVFCELKLGNEHARSRGCAAVHEPEWNELFTFGKVETLTGFEELRIEFFASWPPRSSKPHGLAQGSHSQDDMIANGPPAPLSRSGSLARATTWSQGVDPSLRRAVSAMHTPQQITPKPLLVGVIHISLSAIITKFQDNLLTKWMPLEPLPYTETQENQLPGHVCLCFEVGVEALVERRGTQPRLVLGGIGGGVPGVSGELDESMLSSPTSNRSIKGSQAPSARKIPSVMRHASGSLRQIMSLAASPMSGNFRSVPATQIANGDSGIMLTRVRTESSSTSSMEDNDNTVISQLVPDEWKSKCADALDERSFIVRVFVIRAENLAQRFLAEFAEGSAPMAGEALTIDPYCEVALLDPLNDFQVIQRKRTVIIRDSAAPIWEEEFVFGKEKESPVRGNEILSIAVHHWEVGGKGFKFGEVRIPIKDFRSKLHMKESHVSQLERFHVKTGEHLRELAAPCEVAFAILVDEFVDLTSQAGKSEESSNIELSRSPML